jgi:hypothetical protein
MKTRHAWILVRLAVIASVTAGLLATSAERTNLEWGAAIPLGLLPAVAVFLWLTIVRHRTNIDWSFPYSFGHRFLPMAKFPLRFWFLASCALLFGGAVTVVWDLIDRNGHEAIGGLFFMTGIFLSLTIMLWIKLFAPIPR